MQRSGHYDLEKLEKVVDILQKGDKLAVSHKDHQLKGDLQEYRECHISPDWLLLYRVHKDQLILELIRTGSHSELF